jgi:uncharacterized membrane protein
MKSIRKNVISGLIGVTMAILLIHMGYDFLKWEFSAIVLLAVAYCLNLSEKPNKDQERIAATVVDNITAHRGNMELFWDRTNWQGLCATHHSSDAQIIPIAGESLAEYWERRIKSGDYSILTGVTCSTIEFTDLSGLHFSPAPKDGKLLDGCFIHTSK